MTNPRLGARGNHETPGITRYFPLSLAINANLAKWPGALAAEAAQGAERAAKQPAKKVAAFRRPKLLGKVCVV